MRNAAELLQQTLKEEMETDRRPAGVSRRLVKEAGSREPRKRGEQGRRGRGASRGTSRRAAGSRGGGAAHILTEHEEIRRWAEERGAHPACARGTGGKEDTDMIRLDFPGWSGPESLQPIEWDQWFRKFDEDNLALLVQEQSRPGEKSNFNKIVSRAAAEANRAGTRR